MQQMVSLLQILLLVQHASGTIIPIIRNSRVLYRWLLPVVFGALVFKLSVWCRAEASRKPDTQPTAGFFIADIIACSTCFGHHYAHHQELKSIIQVVTACGIWCSIPQTGHTTHSSTPDQQAENHSTKYHRQ